MIEFKYAYKRAKKPIAYGLQGWRYEYYKQAVSVIIRNSQYISHSPMKNQELEQITKEEFEANELTTSSR